MSKNDLQKIYTSREVREILLKIHKGLSPDILNINIIARKKDEFNGISKNSSGQLRLFNRVDIFEFGILFILKALKIRTWERPVADDYILEYVRDRTGYQLYTTYKQFRVHMSPRSLLIYPGFTISIVDTRNLKVKEITRLPGAVIINFGNIIKRIDRVV